MTTATNRSSSSSLSSFVVTPPTIPSLPVVGVDSLFPVHRIYCVGRNYADHALEMGGDPSREPPFFFTKPADAIVPSNNNNASSGVTTVVPYPLATSDLHHEIELVIAIGQEGTNISVEDSENHIYGYAVGVDLTRRDLQTIAKKASRPWDSAKAFDHSAPISSIVPKSGFKPGKNNGNDDNDGDNNQSDCSEARIWLSVNGQERQNGKLSQMTWKIPEIVSILSRQFHLQPGDLIFTGTPAGVGPLQKGDLVQGGVDGLEASVEFTIVTSS
eukprot:CAMPEP_0198145690 /NCGR_PEP_ID=MMETSP1443-20131203/24846_1 /TAXON_ID=186043 /ORGANISM="Entomoneis sp., Strain CCMP2396" /LENGTH=271 /DNA_ID=CAMNT_0043809391 /DNA_START=135 /DNA_END=950 /DNA_ORIENTATION=-